MEGCLGSLSSEEVRRYFVGILIWNEVYCKSMGRDVVMDKKGKCRVWCVLIWSGLICKEEIFYVVMVSWCSWLVVIMRYVRKYCDVLKVLWL